MKVIRKIIRFPWVVIRAFWEVLKYIWEHKTNLLIPFILGEVTFWLPFVTVCVLSIIFNHYEWVAIMYFWYVTVNPAIPAQIVCTFAWYFIFLKLRRKNVSFIKDECKALIHRIKEIK